MFDNLSEKKSNIINSTNDIAKPINYDRNRNFTDVHRNYKSLYNITDSINTKCSSETLEKSYKKH